MTLCMKFLRDFLWDEANELLKTKIIKQQNEMDDDISENSDLHLSDSEDLLRKGNKCFFGIFISKEGIQFIEKEKMNYEEGKRVVMTMEQHELAFTPESWFINKQNKVCFSITCMDCIDHRKEGLRIYKMYMKSLTLFNGGPVEFFIHTNFQEDAITLFSVKVINLNEELWNHNFQKKALEEKLEEIEINHHIYFLICSHLLLPEYQKKICQITNKIKEQNGTTVVFILPSNETENEEEEEKNLIHIRSVEEDVEPLRYSLEEERTIMTACHQRSFYKKLSNLFKLLEPKYSKERKIFHIESHTRIFIYNCDALDRRRFKKYLFYNFYDSKVVYFDLNTQFGKYFSETEKNIIRIFKKCNRMLIHEKKNILLVLDGIDIIGTEGYQRNKEKYEQTNLKESINEVSNENEQMTRTTMNALLFCLDDITNDLEINERNKIQEAFKEGWTTKTENHIIDLFRVCEESDESREAKEPECSKLLNALSRIMPNRYGRYNLETFDLESIKEKVNPEEYDILKRFQTHSSPKSKKEMFQRRLKLIMQEKKTIEPQISVIVLSNLPMHSFDISFRRPGRFFHFIKYEDK